MSAWGDVMRDPARIPEVLAKVQELWQKVPNLRLGQFLGNVAKSDVKLYYMEDDELVERLVAIYCEADEE